MRADIPRAFSARVANVKKRFPERYKSFLITCGNFHQFGHFMFGGHESYYDCYSGYFARRVLHKEKVPKHIPDFQNDTYTHILSFDLQLTVGTLKFLTSHVTSPPPQLLFSNPMLYDASILSAGGKVAFKFFQNVGNPVLHWLRAGRSADGDKCEKLHAMGFHMHRSTTHKVNCVLITLLALLSTTAVDPAIADIVKATTSLSITGDVLIFGDRGLEYLNLLQDMRDGKFAAFERAIHYSPQIAALLHVSQAWEVLQNGDSRLHDPVTQALLNGANAVCSELVAKLGTDLTVPSDVNPFWHTGNTVKAGTGRSHQPWEDFYRVAKGIVAGKGRRYPAHYASYVQRVLAEHLFKK